MSFNQSMSDKNETQYRKTWRSKSSNQQHRGFSPAYPTISSNHSFKKSNNKAQGGQSRANVTNVNPSDAGAWETSVPFAPPKHTEPSVPQRSSRSVQKAPASQSAFWDEEQAKQRQLKAILNKLTPQNFGKFFEQVQAVNIDNATTLTGVISQIFDKALMEPTFCEMYANFCFYLAAELPDFSEDNEKITFKRLLLNKFREEFERGEREQEESNKADEEGEVKQSEEEREEKKIKARRRMLGNIRLIGELYKKKMLTARIMHDCIKKLLGQQQTPDEEDIEVLCKLMSTIGEMIDHSKAKERMDAYFERMKSLSNNMNLSSRVRFMLQDTIDLRKHSWHKRRKVKGPKKIKEVHRDAAQERQAHSSVLDQESMDFSPRASTMLTVLSHGMGNKEVASSKPSRSDQLSSRSQCTEFSGTTSKLEGESVDNTCGGGGNIESIGSGGDLLTVSGSKDKPLPELSRTKSTTAKWKKKRKEILSKAAAAMVKSDLYGSYKNPEGASETTVTTAAPKQTEPSVPQRSARAVPKAPASQSASVTSDTRAPHTPVKSPGDASKGFSFQFGSVSPGLMNGMQIPARTSSAPPNLDEQKRDQARHESFTPVPSLPTPSVPKHQLPRKDQPSVDQSSAAEAHLQHKAKKDVQVSPTPPASQTQKPSGPPMTGISMPMPFHQPQVSVQFGGPNQQIQSQGMTANSLQMPMPIQLPIGSTQVQQPVFVPGLQAHPMQPPGIMHQAQNLGFTPQMGPQLPQLGNLGISIAAQYPQQQGGKFAGPRKTPVKITHPDTHEELRLDKRADSYPDGGSSAARTHPSVSQSQPMPSFATSHPTSYYTNSYNPNPLFYPSPSSHPLTSSHMPANSQAPRFSYPVSQGPPQSIPFMNPSVHNSLPGTKSGSHMQSVMDPPNLEHARDVHNIISSVPSAAIPVTVKPAVDSLPNSAAAVEKSEFSKPSRPSGEVVSSHPQRFPGSDPSVPKSLPATAKVSVGVLAAPSVESQVSNSLSSTSASPAEESVPVVTATESRKKESLSRSNSIKDQQKKPGKKGNIQPQHQVVGQASSTSSFPSRASEHAISSSTGVSETVEGNKAPVPESIEFVSELSKESMSNVSTATTNVSESQALQEGAISFSSEIPGTGIAVNTSDGVHHSQLGNSSLLDEQEKHELGEAEKQSEQSLSEGYKQDANIPSISSEYTSVKSLESDNKAAEHSVAKETANVNSIATSETAERGKDQLVNCNAELHGMDNNEVASSKLSRSDQPSTPSQSTEFSGTTSKHEGESVDDTCGGGGNIESIGSGGDLLTVSGSKDKPLPELSRTKSTTSKSKKKRKEILSKADAAGVTSDLYGAYKNPDDKKDIASSESAESTSTSIISKQEAADSTQQVAIVRDEGAPSKAEPDDWEDVADSSTPKLGTSDSGEQACGDKDGSGHGAKKYSRDFLLKFSMQFLDLPEGFEIMSDIAEILNANVNASPSIDYDSLPSPGRIIDRPGGAARLDRRGIGMIDDDRWSKGGNANFRPGQGGVNYGVLRSPGPRGQVQHVRGILPGPIAGSQGGMQRNNPDADRWQRATNFQPKGLMPSPQTPLQVMHRAERKYEIGKVSDEEQAKQRQLKAILNKLTPQNFEKLFEQVKAVNIDNATTLTGVISQIFDKALMEPTFCEMYANFCFHLAAELPDFSEDNEKITFKRLLLNKCQEEFERGEREQEEANKADEEGEVKQSEEEREEKRIKARRRMLGNIRLIGELYKKKMLTERIMHECIKKLLGQQQTPDEEDIEALCKLMSTIGEMIDHPKAKEHMDAYFERMKSLSNNMKLSSRVRFMLKDTIDLRKNRWQQRRKVEGPKKIEEVHRDAAQERQAQASRLGRGPGINPSARRGAPMDFSPRGSTMLSPSNAQMGFRGMPSPVRGGFGSQDARVDVRVDERHSYEGRPLSVPLTQRPIGDDSITLGPQGGLARGMSVRGPPSMSATPLPEISSNPGDSRRVTAGLNGFSSLSERGTYNPREDLIPRHVPDRFGGPAAHDQSSAPERNMNFGGRDPRSSDRTPPPTRAQGAALTQNVPSEKSEERLRDMSLGAIKEFYSARDEMEVALCIKDLNSPSFHPSMISLWVTDSFERKDAERDLLAKLLVNLTKSQDGMLSQSQLIKGFETVLSTLEDAVNDAPRAPEFLGLIFAKVILENVVSLNQIGQLIHEGGEEPGHLLEVGLAGNVLGNILEIIKSEKGESVLNEIRMSSNLRLETFRPPDSRKSSILEKFI